MTRNKELFYKIAEVIEKNPNSYNQTSWFQIYDNEGRPVYAEYFPFDAPEVNLCNSAFCIAGWAEHLEGLVPLHNYSTEWVDPKYLPEDIKKVRLDLVKIARLENNLRDNNQLVRVKVDAAERLGLTGPEADWLFCEYWLPRNPLTVSEALRRIGDGESIRELTDEEAAEDLLYEYPSLRDTVS